MDIKLVMNEIAARLATINGLQVFSYPASPVSPPAALLSYPASIDFDETYGRGMDRIRDLPLLIIEGRPTLIDTRDRIAAYTAGSGVRSVKAVLESGTYTTFDEIRVASAEFDVVSIAAVDYLAAIFALDIAGQGV